jgi:predicted AAA+ superfamily ATPase
LQSEYSLCWREPESTVLPALLAVPSTSRAIFIDEVQLIPELLDGIQAIVDAHPRRFQFLLSGSSARKLRRGHANLLPGRIVLYYLHPLLARELGEDFDLDRVLAHGSLPGINADSDPESRSGTLRSYVDAYLPEEVQAEALVWTRARPSGGRAVRPDARHVERCAC